MIGGAGVGRACAKTVVPARKRHRTGTKRFIRSQRGVQTGRYFNPIEQPMCRPVGDRYRRGNRALGAILAPRLPVRGSGNAPSGSTDTAVAIRARKQKRPSTEGLFRTWRPQDQAAAAINSSQVISCVSSFAPSPSMSMTSRTVLASSAIMTITALPAPSIRSSPTYG